MKFSIIADIHANFEALKEVIKTIEKEKVDCIFVCGDIIGYGPDPEVCIEKIFSLTDLIVKGNHEEGIIKNDYSRFKKLSRISIEWTAERTQKYIDKLEKLPDKITFENMLFVHASISDPIYKYIFKKEEAEEEINLMDGKICFFAHTHIPVAYRRKEEGGETEIIMPDFNGRMEFKIEDGYKYLINVGSSGQPRDGLPMVCVSIYDTDSNLFKLDRVNYPSEITKNKVIERGLPSSIGEKFLKGI